VDAILIFDGAKPIPDTLIFCDSCGEWLPSSLQRKQTEELIAVLRLMNAVPVLPLIAVNSCIEGSSGIDTVPLQDIGVPQHRPDGWCAD